MSRVVDGYISRDELFVLIRSLLLVTFGTLSQLHGKQLVLEWADLNSKFCMNSVFAVGELSRPDHVNKEEFSRFVDEFPNLVSWIRLGETILDIPGADIPSPALRLRKNSGETLVVQLKDIENINVQRRNSHLSDLEFGLLFKVFEQEAMNGHLNKAQFRRCLHKLLPSLQPSEEYDEGFKDFQFANLFAMFDLNGDGVVELSEFGAAMSLLCKGTKTEKLLLGFNLFDKNRDGYVSFEELQSYLVSYVLTLMSGLEKNGLFADAKAENTRMAEEMADSTAAEFFHHAGIPRDKLISRKDFLRIYERNQESIPWLGLLEDFFDPVESVDDNKKDSLTVPLNQSGDHTLTILPADLSSFRFLKQHLSAIPISRILDSFAASVQSEQGLSRGDFVMCITSLLPAHRLALEKSKALFSFSLSNLFDMLDRDGNGYVDTTELLVGVHCISHGSKRDKLSLVFHCFDRDGDGRISKEEMFRCFSTFLITVSSLSSLAKAHQPEEMYAVLTEAAEEATRAVFEGAGVDSEDRMTFDQFIDVYDNKSELIPWLQLLEINDPSAEHAPLAGERKVRERRLSMSEADPVVHTLNLPDNLGSFQLRQSDIQDFSLLRVALAGIQVVDLLQVFDRYSDSAGRLNSQGFALSINDLFPDQSDPKFELVHSLLAFFFNLFDAEGTGDVVMMEFIIGMIVLLPLSAVQKISLVFMVLDRDQDASLTHAELLTYMISILKVMFGLSFSAPEQDMEKFNQILPQCAAAYVRQMFAKTNSDIEISFPEFQAVMSKSPESPPWFQVLSMLSVKSEPSDAAFDQYDDCGLSPRQSNSSMQSDLRSLNNSRELQGSVDTNDSFNGSLVIDDASSIAKASSVGSEKLEMFPEMTNMSASSVCSAGWPASWIPPQIGLSAEHTLQLRAESVLRLQIFKTNFVSLETDTILRVFNEHAVGEGMISRVAFSTILKELFPRQARNLADSEADELYAFLDRCFTLLTFFQDDLADSNEFLTGANALCNDDSEEPLFLAFQLADASDDHFLDLQELTSFSRSVLCLLFASMNPEDLPHSPREFIKIIAEQTAQLFFDLAETKHAGYCSFEEFRATLRACPEEGVHLAEWLVFFRAIRVSFNKGSDSVASLSLTSFSGSEWAALRNRSLNDDSSIGSLRADDRQNLPDFSFGVSGISNEPSLEESVDSTSHQGDDVSQADSKTPLFSIPLDDANEHSVQIFPDDVERFRFLRSCFETSSLDNLSNAFRDCFEDAQARGVPVNCLDIVAFHHVMQSLVPSKSMLEKDRQLLSYLLDQCYRVFDRNHDGFVDLNELLRGLSVLMHLNKHKLVALAFMMADVDGNEELTRTEFALFLAGFLRVMTAINLDSKVCSDESTQNLIQETAWKMTQSFFSSATQNLESSRSINFAQFEQICQEQPVPWLSALSILLSHGEEQKEAELMKALDDSINSTAKSGASQVSGSFSASDVSISEFSVSNKSFELNNSVMTSSSRLSASSANQLSQTTSYRVYSNADDSRQMNQSLPNDSDHVISIQLGSKSSAALNLNLGDLPSFGQLRTRLSQLQQAEVVEMFQSEATDGFLDKEAFDRILYRLFPLTDRLTSSTLLSHLSSMFGVFDVNNEGKVSVTNFFQGLILFCSGTYEDKIQFAFQMIDADRDGFLTRTDLTKFLLSLYVLLLTMSGLVKDLAMVDLVKLMSNAAQRKTALYFDIADTDRDGLVSFEEFLTVQDDDLVEWLRLFDVNESNTGSEREILHTSKSSQVVTSEPEPIQDESESELNDFDNSALAAVEAAVATEAPRQAASKTFRVYLHKTRSMYMASDFVRRFHMFRQPLSTFNAKTLAQLFLKYSSDDGFVDMTAFRKLMSVLFSDGHCREMCSLYSVFDRNGDGQIVLQEFSSAFFMLISEPKAARLYYAFKVVDVDGDDIVSMHELFQLFVSQLAILTLFASDINPNERLSLVSVAARQKVHEIFQACGKQDGLSFADFLRLYDEDPGEMQWVHIFIDGPAQNDALSQLSTDMHTNGGDSSQDCERLPAPAGVDPDWRPAFEEPHLQKAKGDDSAWQPQLEYAHISQPMDVDISARESKVLLFLADPNGGPGCCIRAGDSARLSNWRPLLRRVLSKDRERVVQEIYLSNTGPEGLNQEGFGQCLLELMSSLPNNSLLHYCIYRLFHIFAPSGFLSYNMFVQTLRELLHANLLARLRMSFQVIDSNRNETISPDELEDFFNLVLTLLSPKTNCEFAIATARYKTIEFLQHAMKLADNHEGKLTFDTWACCFSNIPELVGWFDVFDGCGSGSSQRGESDVSFEEARAAEVMKHKQPRLRVRSDADEESTVSDSRTSYDLSAMSLEYRKAADLQLEGTNATMSSASTSTTQESKGQRLDDTSIVEGQVLILQLSPEGDAVELVDADMATLSLLREALSIDALYQWSHALKQGANDFSQVTLQTLSVSLTLLGSQLGHVRPALRAVVVSLLRRMCLMFDRSADHNLDLSDIAASTALLGSTTDSLRHSFRAMDSNRDGALEPSELCKYFYVLLTMLTLISGASRQFSTESLKHLLYRCATQTTAEFFQLQRRPSESENLSVVFEDLLQLRTLYPSAVFSRWLDIFSASDEVSEILSSNSEKH